jgi:hypothetical protein
MKWVPVALSPKGKRLEIKLTTHAYTVQRLSTGTTSLVEVSGNVVRT